MGDSCGQGAGVTPGLPPPRDTNEVCVFSEGTQTILGGLWYSRTQCPRQEPGVYHHHHQSCFSASGRASCRPRRTARTLGGGLQPLTLREPLPALGFRFCAVPRALGDVGSHALTGPASVLMSRCSTSASLWELALTASSANSFSGLTPCSTHLKAGCVIHT